MASQGEPVDALVVDASVAVKWHLTDEDYVEQSLELLERFSDGEVVLLAPAQIRYEVPSAITVATQGRQPRLSAELARLAIQHFLSLGIQTRDSDDLITSAYDLAQQYGCAFYDGLYLALSQELGIPFITADSRLYQRIRQLPDVIWIGDYQ